MTLDLDLNQTCQSCGEQFTPTRPWQSFCTKTCAGRLRQKRRRQAQKRRDTAAPVSQQAKWRDSGPAAPCAAPRPIVARPESQPTERAEAIGFRTFGNQTPTTTTGRAAVWGDVPLKPSPLDGRMVLLGDDYPIEMDADGYPVMPECLRRKTT